ncbi:MAG: DUF1611 domain-containing protein [Planctomycetota bacterium]
MPNRSMVLLTYGHTNPRTAKTATGLLRFCPDECIAILDPDTVGQDANELLGVGSGVPIIRHLSEAPSGDTLVLGIAPPGGKIPASWRPILLDAIAKGMNILSGLHDFISDDLELCAAADAHGVQLIDVRKNDFKQIACQREIRPENFRVHTVGHDCSVGKMLVSVTLAQGLSARGREAHFVATGQTGIMVSGEGLPIDCVAADFVSGAAEELVLQSQAHDISVIEGQGSLVHPAYSQVTLGLLHGCRPHALVMVFEAGRTHVGGMPHVPLLSLSRQRELFETMANIYQPCKTIAIAMNGSKVSDTEAAKIADEVSNELQLPVTDVVRDGPDHLLDVVESYYESRDWLELRADNH